MCCLFFDIRVRIHDFKIKDLGLRKRAFNHYLMTRPLIPGYRKSKRKAYLYRHSTMYLKTAVAQCANDNDVGISSILLSGSETGVLKKVWVKCDALQFIAN